jgi:hypothetical protein
MCCGISDKNFKDIKVSGFVLHGAPIISMAYLNRADAELMLGFHWGSVNALIDDFTVLNSTVMRMEASGS